MNGNKLKEWRTRNNLSQSEAAKQADMTQAFWALLESQQKNPSVRTLLALSKLLGCTVNDLLAEE